MKGISNSIATELGAQGIIQEEDIDKCRYGLEVFISSVLEIVSLLFVALFVGNFLETVLLFAAFIPLRIYAGGYHANTKLKCYLISVAVYILFTVIMYILPQELYLTVSVLCTLLSLMMVFTSAPIIHYNKSVNDMEKTYYRKFSVVIVLTETVIILLLSISFLNSKIGISLALGQAAVSLSMIAAIIKQKLCKHR